MPLDAMLLVLAHPDFLADAVSTDLEKHTSIRAMARIDQRTVALAIDAVPRGERGAIAEVCRALQLDHGFFRAPLPLDQYKIMLFDMDSTLIGIECIDELAARNGSGGAVAAITAQAMSSPNFDYDRSMCERVKLLAGLQQADFVWVYENRLRLNPGVRELVSSALQAGLPVGIVSGGFDYFTQRLRHELGLSFAHGNALVFKDGLLTGEMSGPLVNADMKASLLLEACLERQASPAQAIVVGDGANDLAMMRKAGLAVGFKPKKVVQEVADVVLLHRLDGLTHLLNAGVAGWRRMRFP